ncbi:Nudix family hydrolase [Advenella alkanexedens]|uniref:8-oxo-dGTP diphosphatase n=1 Tax=Advenella alkanexedens TaxID=1481665 RepID=A0ABS6NL85_9BURK|nr:Nudix family hydrolase [Advenella alkanexedens]MBV4396389.1 Nudix family hydrolase [Advenella alkanexedens]
MSKPHIHVAVGVIIRDNGEILLGQRPKGKPWEDWWEFPGGKIEAGESVHQALCRELKEELDITVEQATPWVNFVHEYPKNIVHLAFWKVTRWQGTPTGLENQQLAWTQPESAEQLGQLLPASLPPLKWLGIPDRYAISAIGSAANAPAWLEKLDSLLDRGIRLFQLREPNWDEGPKAESLKALMLEIHQRCHQKGARLIINSIHPKAWWSLADGVQLRAQDALLLEERPLPEDKLVGVSAHNLADLLYANIIQADFTVLGHVLPTASHPKQPPLGWESFTQLSAEAGLPVFAIGGMNETLLPVAQQNGAHGIAGISGW